MLVGFHAQSCRGNCFHQPRVVFPCPSFPLGCHLAVRKASDKGELVRDFMEHEAVIISLRFEQGFTKSYIAVVLVTQRTTGTQTFRGAFGRLASA